jgi:hypothetical protein
MIYSVNVVVKELFTEISVKARLHQMTRDNGINQILSHQFSPTKSLQHATSSSMACQAAAVIQAMLLHRVCVEIDTA